MEKLGIGSELLGPDPNRLNFVARLKGNGTNRPLLLMAHSDVVPADRTSGLWTPLPLSRRTEVLYGRGAVDDKSSFLPPKWPSSPKSRSGTSSSIGTLSCFPNQMKKPGPLALHG